MSKTNYAPEGYVYLVVNTPGTFREIMVRDDPAKRTTAEREVVESLHRCAENLGTSVVRNAYRLG